MSLTNATIYVDLRCKSTSQYPIKSYRKDVLAAALGSRLLIRRDESLAAIGAVPGGPAIMGDSALLVFNVFSDSPDFSCVEGKLLESGFVQET